MNRDAAFGFIGLPAPSSGPPGVRCSTTHRLAFAASIGALPRWARYRAPQYAARSILALHLRPRPAGALRRFPPRYRCIFGWNFRRRALRERHRLPSPRTAVEPGLPRTGARDPRPRRRRAAAPIWRAPAHGRPTSARCGRGASSWFVVKARARLAQVVRRLPPGKRDPHSAPTSDDKKAAGACCSLVIVARRARRRGAILVRTVDQSICAAGRAAQEQLCWHLAL